MASDYLYAKLAEALSRPSDAYLAAQEGLEIPKKAAAGYNAGADFADSIRRRREDRQTLSEVLGGSVEGLSPELQNLPFGRIKEVGSSLGDLAKFSMVGRQDENMLARQKFAMEQQERAQAERLRRQKDQQAFVREMFRGNKDAIAESQDALKAADAMRDLNMDLDKLTPLQARLNSTAYAKVANPQIAAKKSNILLYAGFSRGGKQLTGTELGVVVDALTPTGLDNAESRHMKNRVFQDWAQGKIDLNNAANLLGAAGAPLIKVAHDQRLRNEQDRKKALMGTMGGGESGGDDLNSLFGSEGL